MRIEERGSRSEESGVGGKLNPRSSLLDPASMQRMRWRCRRGLLELDIVLGRFIEQHYAHLDEAQRLAFDTLLDMPDTALWDMIAGRDLMPRPGEQGAVLKLLQAV
ncbi:MAG: succinate dehydrogenase assembly factor 2 [Gallionellaceae bacterium]|nr:succinate dehydrogenase assembly factor 2 [Gallionellaceae bacterium]